MVESLKAGLYLPASDMKLEWVKGKKFEKPDVSSDFNVDLIKTLTEHGAELRESGLTCLFSRVLKPPSPLSLEYAETLRTRYNAFEESLKAAIERERAKYSEPDFSFLRKRITEWREAVAQPPLTVDAIEKFLADVRQVTEAFSDFALRSSQRDYFAGAEPLPGKRGGGLLRTIRVTFAYRKAVRKLERCVNQFKALINEAYESQGRPDNEPSLADTISKIEKLTRGTKRDGSKSGADIGKLGGEEKKDDKRKTPPPPQPPPPAPQPPPYPPRHDDDQNNYNRQLKPEYQKAANNIADNILDSVQEVLSVAIDMSFRGFSFFNDLSPASKRAFKDALLDNMRDMLPTLGPSGRSSVYQELNDRLKNLENYFERAVSEGVKVDEESKKTIANAASTQTAAKLRKENLVRPKEKLFVDPKNLTAKQKQKHDIKVLWSIQRLEANSSTSSTIGIEEAARIAKNAGLLYWYKTAHSASVSYRKLKNNTLSARWDEISGCSPEQIAEVKAKLDEFEKRN